jgi:short-subunit dehydrogenase
MGHADLARVLTTGASNGLGAALARALVAAGSHVFLCARNEPELRARADSIARDCDARVGWSRVARIVDLLGLPYDVVVDELTIHPVIGDY